MFCSLLSCFAAGVFLATCLLCLYPGAERKLTVMLDGYLGEHNKYLHYPIAESCQQYLQESYRQHTTICPGQQHPSSSHSGKVAMPVKVVGVGSTVTWQGEPQVHQTASLVGPPVRRPPPHCSLSTLSCKPVFKHSSMIKPNRCTVKQRTRQSPLRSLMMLAALSLHSVFEGLSVG